MNVDNLPLSSVLMVALTVVMLLFLIFSPKPSVLVCARANDKSTAKADAKAGAGADARADADDKVGDKASVGADEKAGNKSDNKASNHRISEEEKIRNLRARVKKVSNAKECTDPEFPFFDAATSTCVQCFASSFNCLEGYQDCLSGLCVKKTSPQCAFYPTGVLGGSIDNQRHPPEM